MKYPRCFAVLNKQFSDEVAEQLFEMNEGHKKKKIYIPSLSKKVASIDAEIDSIKSIDERFKGRGDTKIVVFQGTSIDYLSYIRILDYEPCTYWIGSIDEFVKIRIGMTCFSELDEMQTLLRAGGNKYADAAQRYYDATGEYVPSDDYFVKMYHYGRRDIVSNVEATVNAWMRSCLKIGVVKRFDI